MQRDIMLRLETICNFGICRDCTIWVGCVVTRTASVHMVRDSENRNVKERKSERRQPAAGFNMTA